MHYTEWLRRQVARLENEIRSNPLLDSETPATPEQLRELRQTIVLYTYLKQQLLRRERVQFVIDDFDSKELALPKPVLFEDRRQ
ncbi:MAG TPA: hypothetical protein VFT12_01625 [Thermoanaerobaculia bacterium]|nr:hypothetical protein [Thermoanaerobaculia bacterium]